MLIARFVIVSELDRTRRVSDLSLTYCLSTDYVTYLVICMGANFNKSCLERISFDLQNTISFTNNLK